jgi:hypothetical protein
VPGIGSDGEDIPVVFLYSKTDREHVSKIAEILSQKGTQITWISLTREGTDTFPRQQLPEKSQAVLWFIGSKKETYQHFVQSALARGQRVIPVLLPGAVDNDLPPSTRLFPGFDLRESSVDERSLMPVIRALRMPRKEVSGISNLDGLRSFLKSEGIASEDLARFVLTATEPGTQD